MKTETAKSHVMMYGDAIDAEVVSNFQGTTDSAATKGAASSSSSAEAEARSADLRSADA